MWNGRTEPAVSILCPTYNHSTYIQSAIDGCLGQVTDFPFELIVRDDASQDGTSDVIRDYSTRYPHIIRPLYETSNTYSKGLSARAAMMPIARGGLIALCDGDDYWTSEHKLQRQVDALRRNANASLCCTDGVSIVDNHVNDVSLFSPKDRPAASDEPTEWNNSTTPLPSTWVFRRDSVDFTAPELGKLANGDTFILRQLQAAGRVLVLPQPMTAYRLHAAASWSTLSDRTRHAQLLNTDLHISGYFFRTRKARLGRANALAAARRALVEIERYHPSARRWLLFYSLLLAAKRLWWWRRKGS